MTLDKPYLDTIDPAPDQVSATLEWITYLGKTFGTSGALDALRYYERVGWISESVRQELTRYLRGLSLDEIHAKKYDEPGTLTGTLEGLSGTAFGTHARSLRYVATIAQHDLEGHLMVAKMARHRVEERNGGESSMMHGNFGDALH
jgi:hypothetical protein